MHLIIDTVDIAYKIIEIPCCIVYPEYTYQTCNYKEDIANILKLNN